MADSERQGHPDFPAAVNGDVHISISNTHKYTLHSSVLRRSSLFFAEQLLDETTPVPERAKKDGVRVVRWRFELRDRPDDGEDGCGRLVMLELDSKGMIKPTLHTTQEPRQQKVSGAARPQPAVDGYYDRVIGALHSLPFPIDDHDLGTLLREVLGLTSVSEYLGCGDLINGRLNLALLNQNQVLYHAIANNPSAWVGLGLRIESDVVFREAVIHLVGQWNSIPSEQKYDPDFLPSGVREFCQRKHDEVQALKARIEHQIVKYYPSALTRDPNEQDSFNRQSYSNDVFGWIAITLFKHWFGAALASDKGRHADDGGCWLYNAVAQGKDAYLGSKEVSGFHHRVPMSVKGKAVFEKWLGEIKNDVRMLVAPLLVSYSSLGARGDGKPRFDYLTCVQVERKDLPWVSEKNGGRMTSRRPKRNAEHLGERSKDAMTRHDREGDEYDSDDFGDGMSEDGR